MITFLGAVAGTSSHHHPCVFKNNHFEFIAFFVVDNNIVCDVLLHDEKFDFMQQKLIVLGAFLFLLWGTKIL